MFDVTEAAGARAHVAQHQEGGRAGAPTFAHIRAHGLLADGVQRLGAHQGLQMRVRLAGGGAHFDPFRAAEREAVDAFGIDPVTGGGGGHRLLDDLDNLYQNILINYTISFFCNSGPVLIDAVVFQVADQLHPDLVDDPLVLEIVSG